ncbi:MAG: alpha/beta hydrolase [Aridibacter famidurans]|nr:alpha/beta hydrolase [Aridibacter famidurans]
MKSAFLLVLFLSFSIPVFSSDTVEISLVNGTEDEAATKKQLERLIGQYDLSKWTFTRTIKIDKDSIPHSHPVLTLSTRHLKDDDLLLSTYVHEQIHWFVSEDQQRLASSLEEIKKMYPEVPAGGPEGARDERSTYLHIPVVYLEYRAARELLGELRAMHVMNFWKTDHYRWIYRTVHEQAREIGQVMFKHGLVPGLSRPAAESSETGFIDVGDTRLFYEKIGSGPETVVVPFHFFMFENFKRLAKGRTMIFYDARNRGRSDRVEDESKITIQEDVEDIEKIRKHFKLNKITLIGESYVGLLVAMYAMKYPQNVERLVQIGAVPFKFGTEYPPELTAQDDKPVPDPDLQKRVDELRTQGVDKSDPKRFCEEDWKISQQYMAGDPSNGYKIKSPCEMENEWPVNLARHFDAHFTSVQRLDITPEMVKKIKVPVLTIHGTKDRNVPYGAGKEWSETLPNSTFVTVKGAAHFPWVDDEEAVLGAIERFLGKK